jgi:S1-C subfamily serine protease
MKKAHVEILLWGLFLFGVLFVNENYIHKDRQYIKSAIENNVVIEAVVPTVFGKAYSIGSGVKASNWGLIVTAKHCVEGASYIKVTGKDFTCYTNVWYLDKQHDLAIVVVPKYFDSYATLGCLNDISMGDRIFAVGNPSGIWDNSVLKGRIYDDHFERLALSETGYFIFFKADAKPGYSGGGVYNKDKLIGILVSGTKDATFVVPVEYVRSLLEEYNAR